MAEDETKKSSTDASNDAAGSLETDETNSLESKPDTATETEEISPAKTKKPAGSLVRNIITRVNIYFLLFIMITVIAAGIVAIAFQRNKKESTETTITTQPLSKEALEQLQGSDAKVGDPKQTLTVESNAIFAGKVLIRDSLDVAGTIKVGGALSLPGISVSGTSTFDQITANSLSINGALNVAGTLSVNGLTSTGGGTFGGPVSAPIITAQSLQLTGDLQITRHIDAGGSTPSKSDGSALGNGGTTSISGTDTAGTITINTGSNPGAGCFVTVRFANRFSSTPHVTIGAIGSAAGAVNYYLNRSSTEFSICSSNNPSPGQTFSYDYIVID